jgi:hypothetical protein
MTDECDPWEEERNVYKGKSRESYVENDEMSPEEEAFMIGYDGADDEEPVELNQEDDEF